MLSLPLRQTTFVCLTALLSSLANCQTLLGAAEAESFTGNTMGPIVYNVTVVDMPSGESRDSVHQVISAALEDVNNRMSTYKDDSEVSRFNHSTSTDWFEVAPATARVVARALEISAASEGAFDVTVAPLVNLWHFGPEGQPAQPPTSEQIEKALQNVGYQHLAARLDPPAIKKAIPQLKIDLSAIAKGFAVDEVAKSLETLGSQQYMVEVGGEVRTRGLNAEGRPWVIGVENPEVGVRSLAERVTLIDKGMATSGDYRNFFVAEDGTFYSHTINPKTGQPVAHGLRSVSVIARDCMTADAWATALMVLGPDEIQNIAAAQRIDVLWMVQAPAGKEGVQLAATDGFPSLENSDGPQTAGSPWPVVLAAVIVFAVALVGMSVGVIFSNRRIQGSCGGLAALRQGDLSSPCEICESRATCEDYKSHQSEVAHEATSTNS